MDLLGFETDTGQESKQGHSDFPIHESIGIRSSCGRVGTGAEVVSTGGSYEIDHIPSSFALRLRDFS